MKLLSNIGHTDTLKPETLRALGLTLSILLLVIAWGATIWLALQVSTVVLDSLRMIVELAGIAPDPQ